MLFRVEALLESLSEAGTAVDLATQAAFKDLRTRTLKQQQEAFAAKAGKPTKKIEWGAVSLDRHPAGRNGFTALVLTFVRCATARGGEDWRSRTGEWWCVENNRPLGPPSNSAYGGALAAGGGGVKGTEGLDDLFATAPAPQPAGEWIEAFDKNRCATAGCWALPLATSSVDQCVLRQGQEVLLSFDHEGDQMEKAVIEYTASFIHFHPHPSSRKRLRHRQPPLA